MNINQLGASDSSRVTRPYVPSSRDDKANSRAGRHCKPGPAVVMPVRSSDLAWADTVAADPNADLGEARAACDLITEHSLTGNP
jgi:hypothetical protein